MATNKTCGQTGGCQGPDSARGLHGKPDLALRFTPAQNPSFQVPWRHRNPPALTVAPAPPSHPPATVGSGTMVGLTSSMTHTASSTTLTAAGGLLNVCTRRMSAALMVSRAWGGISRPGRGLEGLMRASQREDEVSLRTGEPKIRKGVQVDILQSWPAPLHLDAIWWFMVHPGAPPAHLDGCLQRRQCLAEDGLALLLDGARGSGGGVRLPHLGVHTAPLGLHNLTGRGRAGRGLEEGVALTGASRLRSRSACLSVVPRRTCVCEGPSPTLLRGTPVCHAASHRQAMQLPLLPPAPFPRR